MCFCLLPVTGFKFEFYFAGERSRLVILNNFYHFWTIVCQEKCFSCSFSLLE